MTGHATGKFKVKGWKEDAYLEEEGGRKLTRAIVEQTFSGDVEGEGSVQWLMYYRPDQTADFVGLQRVEGTVGDRPGSFVLQSNGAFDGKAAVGKLTIVPGSGTGELSGIAGEGSFNAPLGGGEATVSLEYELEG